MSIRAYFRVLVSFFVATCFSFASDGTLGVVENGGGSYDVTYSSNVEIGGFQFNVDGSLSTASGGDAQSNGFMISTGGGLILGFSLTGSSIPAGSGVLVELTGSDITTLTGLVVSDPSGNQLDFSFEEQSSDDPHFVFDLESTGESQLVILRDSITSLDAGDEVGIFDLNGITNYNDCSNQIGELLVAAGVWTGSQLNLSAVGSVDLCAFGGPQLAGYVEGNPLVLKVWKASEQVEYEASFDLAAGNGVFGDLITAVSEIYLDTETYGCTDEDACNYNPDATADDGSCLENDCLGDCGGDAVVDECGVCDGDGGTLYYLDTDNDGLGYGYGQQFCSDPGAGWVLNNDDDAPNCQSNIIDECGVCDGDDSTCTGCSDSSAFNYNCVTDSLPQGGLGCGDDILIDDGSCIYSPEGFVFNQSTLQAFYFVQSASVDGTDLDFRQDWIGLFNGDVCVGAYPWNGGSNTSVPAMGDDGKVYSEGYLEDGDVPSFMIYDYSEDSYYNAQSSQSFGWEENEIFVVDSVSSDSDCNGDPGGSAFVDDCGVCSGGNSDHEANSDIDDCGVCFGENADQDCSGECFGDAVVDDCGVCDGDNADQDCSGECFGDAVIDDCGVCDGDNADQDCSGECFGDSVVDDCGVCDGGNADQDCNGECFGDAVIDDCGVCDGGNADQDCNGECFGDAVEDLFGICEGDSTIQGAIDASEPGSDLLIPDSPEGCWSIIEPISIEKPLNVQGSCLAVDASYAIEIKADNVNLNGFGIQCAGSYCGDFYAGIIVRPSSNNIVIENNLIAGVGGSNPSNDSPLGYGVLVYGDSPAEMPTNIEIKNNVISYISGAAVSLGTFTNSVTIQGNEFSQIIPVDVLGQQISIGVQAEIAGNLTITDNTFDGIVIASNLLQSEASVYGNNYSNVGSFLTETTPSGVDFNEDLDWWLASFTLPFEGIDFNFQSYASSLYLAISVAEEGSTIYTSDGDSISQDCNGQWDGDAVIDECGVCDGGNADQDCSGECFGDAVVDDCGVCDGGNADQDCSGECFGDAVVDDCGVCDGGNADQDCSGECFGDAVVDDCGVCDGGNADQDCSGECFGDAVVDDCGVCDGGNADQDCNGDCFGDAVVDDCGVCSGGNSDHEANSDIDDCGVCFGDNADQDCSGECFGDAVVDDCGVCDGGNADQDCSGECFGDAVVDDCGVCDGGNADQDCNGECFGDAVVDDCGVCDGGNADQDCSGECFGDAVVDDCGVCDGGNADQDCAVYVLVKRK